MNTHDNLDNPDDELIPDQPETKPKQKRPGRKPRVTAMTMGLTPEDLLTKKKQRKYSSRMQISNDWPKILKAIGNGYTLTEICNVFGHNRNTMQTYLNANAHRMKELQEAKYKTRDDMLQVILDAAARGNWIPAAWFLERVFPHTFAKPEVKLQMYDRLVNNDVVQQKIGGKSIEEIATELKLKYGDNENVQRFFSDAGTGPTAGSVRDNKPEGVSE